MLRNLFYLSLILFITVSTLPFIKKTKNIKNIIYNKNKKKKKFF